MAKSLLALSAALLLLAAPAAAHVTTTVDAPTAPLVVGVPTELTVHFSEPCFEVLPQELQGQSTVASGLTADAPASFAWVGESVPFTTDMCDFTALPFATVRTSAKLVVVPSALAPGLTNITLPVTSFLGGGSEPGDVVDLNVTVAYFAKATLKVAATTGKQGAASTDHGHGGGSSSGTPGVDVFLDYGTNADSLLTFEATSSLGTLTGLKPVAVAPPALDNKSTAQLHATLPFTAPANWTQAMGNADITVKAYLAPKVGGAKVLVGEAKTSFTAPAAGDDHDATEHAHDEEKDAPGVAPSLLVLGLVGLAMVLRRRT